LRYSDFKTILIKVFDVILDSTPLLPPDNTSTLMDQQMNSPAWRKDPLIGLGGPMTRNRAKKMKEALHGLVRAIQRDTKLRVEEEAKKITLLKVENADGVSDSCPCAAAQHP